MATAKREPVFKTFGDIAAHVLEDVSLAFEEAVERRAGERIDRVALVTDDDALSASLSVDTAERREARRAKMAERSAGQRPSAFEYDWNTGEWESIFGPGAPRTRFPTIGNQDSFEGMMAFQSAQQRAPGYGDGKFRRSMLGLFLMTLAELDRRGTFGSGAPRNDVVLFIEITDSNRSLACLNESVRRLNPAEARRRFRRTFTWSERGLTIGAELLRRIAGLGRSTIGRRSHA